MCRQILEIEVTDKKLTKTTMTKKNIRKDKLLILVYIAACIIVFFVALGHRYNEAFLRAVAESVTATVDVSAVLLAPVSALYGFKKFPYFFVVNSVFILTALLSTFWLFSAVNSLDGSILKGVAISFRSHIVLSFVFCWPIWLLRLSWRLYQDRMKE